MIGASGTKKTPSAKIGQQISRHLQTQARLADAGRADQGDEAFVGCEEIVTHLGRILFAPDERIEGRGQIGARFARRGRQIDQAPRQFGGVVQLEGGHEQSSDSRGRGKTLVLLEERDLWAAVPDGAAQLFLSQSRAFAQMD